MGQGRERETHKEGRHPLRLPFLLRGTCGQMIAVVENLAKRREPLPTLSGVYFITPTEESLNGLINDFKTKPLYKTAHVFFSTRIDQRILAAFRSQAPPALLSCLKTLKEVQPLVPLPWPRTCLVLHASSVEGLYRGVLCDTSVVQLLIVVLGRHGIQVRCC